MSSLQGIWHCGAEVLASVWLVVLKSKGQALQGQLVGGRPQANNLL